MCVGLYMGVLIKESKQYWIIQILPSFFMPLCVCVKGFFIIIISRTYARLNGVRVETLLSRNSVACTVPPPYNTSELDEKKDLRVLLSFHYNQSVCLYYTLNVQWGFIDLSPLCLISVSSPYLYYVPLFPSHPKHKWHAVKLNIGFLLSLFESSNITTRHCKATCNTYANNRYILMTVHWNFHDDI